MASTPRKIIEPSATAGVDQVAELVRSPSRLLYHTDNWTGFRVVLVVEGLLVVGPGDSPQDNDHSQSGAPANDQATPDQTP